MDCAAIDALDVWAEVLENRDLGADYGLLRLRAPVLAKDFGPGRFVMVETSPGLTPLLRRPMSIQQVKGDVLELLYKVVGEGTARMGEWPAGSSVRLLGPLGRAWSLPQKGETAILLGGGVGIAPLVILADALDAHALPWRAYLGVASHEHLGAAIGFEGRPGVVIATMDGSAGQRGTVLDAWATDARAPTGSLRLYACGPTRMLEAVQRLALERDLAGELSVETLMACGVGLCMGCVVEARQEPASAYDRWLLACRHGPVFDLRAIVVSDDLRTARGRGFLPL